MKKISQSEKKESRLRSFYDRRLKSWVRALTNPHLLICFALAWFITNGWAYAAAGIGYFAGIDWMRNIGMVYLGILWMPGTPEKLFTFAIAIFLLKHILPDDERTLSMLIRKRKQVVKKVKEDIAGMKMRIRSFFRRRNEG